MHLPRKWELADFLSKAKIPISVPKTKSFCKTQGLICWFPLLDKKLWEDLPVEQYYAPGGHFSVLGNQKVADFVQSQLLELKQKGLLK